MLLSVIIPVFNERDFILAAAEKVMEAPYNKEIIIVDDGSNDGTREILASTFSVQRPSSGKQREKRQRQGAEGKGHGEERQGAWRRGHDTGMNSFECGDGRISSYDSKCENEVKVIFHDKNTGKGGAVRTGFAEAQGDVVLIQDADLEYDPVDYPVLLEPILQGKADVVYGSRFLGGPHRVLYFWHYMGNKLITLVSNMLTDLNLTDMETGYKVFRRDVLDGIKVQSNRFGFEPEITAKLAKKGCIIYEVPISYHGRSYAEGKKITWRDGVRAVFTIIKYNWFDR